MMTSDLITDIKSFLPDSQIEAGESHADLLGNNGEIAVYPQTEEEIASIVKYANDNGKTIALAGMGTKRGFGGLAGPADLLLSLERYNGVIEHAAGDMTVTVKAGTKFKELQASLAKHNQMVSLDPAWPEYATIGGIVAANDSGPKRLGYGSARDAVIGLKIVYPDGQIIRTGGKVVKNVAGYDMNKLFIGSMGTLGVISEITLKLRPIPKYASLALLTFPNGNLEEVRSVAVKLLDSMMEPISLEILNPGISDILTGQSVYILAVSFEDVESSVHYQEEFVKRIQPADAELILLNQVEAEVFWNHFNNLAPSGLTVNTGSGEIIEAALKIGVKNLDILRVMKETQYLADTNPIVVQAHGGLGHGLCGVILKGTAEDILSAIRSLRESVKQLGGYLVVKHLPLSLRQAVNVWGENPSYFFLIEGIKNKVDPKRTMNHQRFVGGV
jgi:glycolate oxidase FAD binding subunit